MVARKQCFPTARKIRRYFGSAQPVVTSVNLFTLKLMILERIQKGH